MRPHRSSSTPSQSPLRSSVRLGVGVGVGVGAAAGGASSVGPAGAGSAEAGAGVADPRGAAALFSWSAQHEDSGRDEVDGAGPGGAGAVEGGSRWGVSSTCCGRVSGPRGIDAAGGSCAASQPPRSDAERGSDGVASGASFTGGPCAGAPGGAGVGARPACSSAPASGSRGCFGAGGATGGAEASRPSAGGSTSRKSRRSCKLIPSRCVRALTRSSVDSPRAPKRCATLVRRVWSMSATSSNATLPRAGPSATTAMARAAGRETFLRSVECTPTARTRPSATGNTHTSTDTVLWLATSRRSGGAESHGRSDNRAAAVPG